MYLYLCLSLCPTATKKPEYKFKHIYESKVNAPILSSYISQQEEQESLPTTTTTTAAPEIVLNAEADHNFLTTSKFREGERKKAGKE